MTQTFLAVLVTKTVDPWYNNSWVVGLATGIVSGALLALVTPIFLRRKRARDLAIRQDRAAEDTLAALRPSVATGNLPSTSVVEATVRACAFRRGLDPKQATPVAILVDVLVSEVMISDFLAPDIRLSLSDKLVTLESELKRQPAPTEELKANDNYRNTTIVASVIGALVLGAAGAVSTFTKSWVPFVVVAVSGLSLLTLWLMLIGRWSAQMRFGPMEISLHDSYSVTNARMIGEKFTDTSEAMTTTSNGSDASKQSTTSQGE